MPSATSSMSWTARLASNRAGSAEGVRRAEGVGSGVRLELGDAGGALDAGEALDDGAVRTVGGTAEVGLSGGATGPVVHPARTRPALTSSVAPRRSLIFRLYVRHLPGAAAGTRAPEVPSACQDIRIAPWALVDLRSIVGPVFRTTILVVRLRVG
ncbi:MAG: hypothetical protein AVDCRST_MAG61-2699 [uncultured Friedmanniella sp.]|uniref:Uncharacterized protein n=1 Tax=uncultured Friedmanniella sp. TaxID=335381 RepID=A0A6J4L566_9ACTN|nr:MAG: hypothetical protein AVDCRST_MAG61-2699 [uncultured Friedmanniella sp.]